MTDADVSIPLPEPRVTDRKAHWRHHIQAWQGSGLSQRAYCRENNLKEYRFSKWKNRLVKDNAAGRFVRVPLSVNLPVPVKRGMLQVYCPSGFRVEINEGFDPILLKKLLCVLAEVPHAL